QRADEKHACPTGSDAAPAPEVRGDPGRGRLGFSVVLGHLLLRGGGPCPGHGGDSNEAYDERVGRPIFAQDGQLSGQGIPRGGEAGERDLASRELHHPGDSDADSQGKPKGGSRTGMAGPEEAALYRGGPRRCCSDEPWVWGTCQSRSSRAAGPLEAPGRTLPSCAPGRQGEDLDPADLRRRDDVHGREEQVRGPDGLRTDQGSYKLLKLHEIRQE